MNATCLRKSAGRSQRHGFRAAPDTTASKTPRNDLPRGFRNIPSFAIFAFRSQPPTGTPPERAGLIRSGAGNCLTEPGIVCFPVAPRLKLNTLFDSSDGEALRGPRRSFGGP